MMSIVARLDAAIADLRQQDGKPDSILLTKEDKDALIACAAEHTVGITVDVRRRRARFRDIAVLDAQPGEPSRIDWHTRYFGQMKPHRSAV